MRKALIIILAHAGVAAAGGGPWTDQLKDVALLNNWIYTILILVTITFDKILHELRHWLEHRAHVHAKKDIYDRMPDPHSSAADMHLRIFTRFSGEMMTLGFLAFVVWACNFGGLFPAIVENYPFLESASSSSDSGESSSSDSSASSSDSSASSSDSGVGRMLASGSSSGSEQRISTDGDCSPDHRIPPTGADLLHQVEAVHFALFIGMVFYFSLTTWVCNRMVDRFKELTVAEALEALDRDPIGKTEKKAMARLKRYRAYVLEHIRSHPDILKKQHREQMGGATLDEKHFFFTFFLENTTLHNVDNLVEFPLYTWCMLFTYHLLKSIALTFVCVPPKTIEYITDGYFLVTTLYISARLVVYYRRSVSGALRDLWPAPWIDRIVSPFVGPGVMGFLPWESEPQEHIGLWCQQVLLFFHLQFVSLHLCDNVYSCLYRGDIFEQDPSARRQEQIVFALQILVIGFWAHVLMPYILEIFAMPPWLADGEVHMIVQIMKAYPNGCDKQTAAMILGEVLPEHGDEHGGEHGGEHGHAHARRKTVHHGGHEPREEVYVMVDQEKMAHNAAGAADRRELSPVDGDGAGTQGGGLDAISAIRIETRLGEMEGSIADLQGRVTTLEDPRADAAIAIDAKVKDTPKEGGKSE